MSRKPRPQSTKPTPTVPPSRPRSPWPRCSRSGTACCRRCCGNARSSRSRAPGRSPGGVLAPDETLEASIRRHLAAKVDLGEVAHLEQVATYGDPGRNPVEWEIATAYLGLVPLGVDPSVPRRHGLASGRRPSPDRLRPRRDHPLGARPAARQAVVLEHRLRPRAGDVHAERAPRRLHGGARLRRLGDEPQARARPPRRARADRRPPRSGPSGGRPAEEFAFAGQALEITDPFAALRPPDLRAPWAG